VFDAQLDAVEVRVYFQRFHTTPPDGPADTEVVNRHMRTFRRDTR
jgi:hypothetical protein